RAKARTGFVACTGFLCLFRGEELRRAWFKTKRPTEKSVATTKELAARNRKRAWVLRAKAKNKRR
ncbi:MAG: hypothetical protein ACRC4K_14870, partial [Plesiomonas shigelloides]